MAVISWLFLCQVFVTPRKPFAMKQYSNHWLFKPGSLLHGLLIPRAQKPSLKELLKFYNVGPCEQTSMSLTKGSQRVFFIFHFSFFIFPLIHTSSHLHIFASSHFTHYVRETLSHRCINTIVSLNFITFVLFNY